MSDYRAPTDDMLFVLEHIAGLPELANRQGYDHADLETVEGVLGEAARFMEEQLAPLNQKGDQEGVVVENGQIFHPDGFADAYARFVEAGWNGIALDESHGGGGMPWCVGLAVQEMMTASNMAFSLCPLLTQGAIDAISHHASETLQEIYLPKMVSGEWSGTMNLTEPHAGSDVGALTTKAVPQEDGTWLVSGTKIFITYGEHELSENIIHLVLARTPDAPPGTKGISLFIVPKFLVNDDGSLGERNDLRVVSSEHKIGIHASPTCVMSYGDESGAVGWMVGEENTGMGAMFTMMNNARLSVGLQGLSLTDRSYQQARQYSLDRKQGKAIGAQLEAGDSSPIADHADVRRMLMTMRANAEAMRCVMYANAAAIDFANSSDDETEREYWDAITALLTPISKGWGTDVGVEMTSLGVQTHGGMGYVEETGAAQHWRDVRIAPIYEGTNGIQAADLVGRKLGADGGKHTMAYGIMIKEVADRLIQNEALTDMVGKPLMAGLGDFQSAGQYMMQNGMKDPNAAMAGSTDFLHLVGHLTMGYMLALSAEAAQAALEAGTGDAAFYTQKLLTVRHYMTRHLPMTRMHLKRIQAGPETVMAPDAAAF